MTSPVTTTPQETMIPSFDFGSTTDHSSEHPNATKPSMTEEDSSRWIPWKTRVEHLDPSLALSPDIPYRCFCFKIGEKGECIILYCQVI